MPEIRQIDQLGRRIMYGCKANQYIHIVAEAQKIKSILLRRASNSSVQVPDDVISVSYSKYCVWRVGTNMYNRTAVVTLTPNQSEQEGIPGTPNLFISAYRSLGNMFFKQKHYSFELHEFRQSVEVKDNTKIMSFYYPWWKFNSTVKSTPAPVGDTLCLF